MSLPGNLNEAGIPSTAPNEAGIVISTPTRPLAAVPVPVSVPVDAAGLPIMPPAVPRPVPREPDPPPSRPFVAPVPRPRPAVAVDAAGQPLALPAPAPLRPQGRPVPAADALRINEAGRPSRVLRLDPAVDEAGWPV